MNAKSMQIEMERRIALISPDLLIENKPTSDTLFSFLNAAQDRYVKINYLGDDQTANDSHAFMRNVDSIKSLLVQETLTNYEFSAEGFRKYTLPEDYNKKFFLYVSSNSYVDQQYSTYRSTAAQPELVNNRLIKPQDLDKYKTTAHNTPIIREPGAVVISDPQSKDDYLLIAVDKYTTINKIILTYYRQPLRINTISGDYILNECELPESVHSEIVDMAVDMFISEAKYRLNAKPAQAEQRQEQ